MRAPGHCKILANYRLCKGETQKKKEKRMAGLMSHTNSKCGQSQMDNWFVKDATNYRINY